jgi:hypothetical protein
MPDPTQFDPDEIRVVLDHGEVVESDGGTLVLDGEESQSVVLRFAPWRARSWPGCCRSGRQYRGSCTIRLGRTWTSWIWRGHWSWPPLCSVTAMSRSCGHLAARVSSLTGNGWPPWQSWVSVRRTSLRCSASPWSMPPRGGSRIRTPEELAYALLTSASSAEVTTEHVYLALITPTDEPGDYGESPSS